MSEHGTIIESGIALQIKKTVEIISRIEGRKAAGEIRDIKIIFLLQNSFLSLSGRRGLIQRTAKHSIFLVIHFPANN